MMNCLLCGVGGQGTVLASRVIAQTAMEAGQFARTAAPIGMAQRGGCVVSHVRVGAGCASALIPLGQADVLIAFEPGEGVRCLPYLKPGGTVIVNPAPVQPVTAALSGGREDGEEMVAYLRRKAGRVVVVDGPGICQSCGSAKVLNTALLGAAVASGALGLTLEQTARTLRARLPEKVHAMHVRALELGAAAVEGERVL